MNQDCIPYLSLEPEIEDAIKEDRIKGRRSDFAFRDDDIVRREDNPHDAATVLRSAFQRDKEKIVNIPAYNRYADKTQVFSFVENDDICRRGLHVQLVSSVARSIGSLLGLNEQLIEAIALGHDLGHTPFGHAGERFLNECYHARTGRYFNHNVQSVRVMDKLYRRNVSLQTLDGAICHNGEFAQQKLLLGEMTSFAALDETVENCTSDQANIKKLRPSTLEGCVVRASDMIAYIGKDRYDAQRVGVIDGATSFDSDYIGTTNSQIINNMTVDIVNNSYGKDHLEMSEEAFNDIVVAKRQNYEKIYLKEGMVSDTQNVIAEMFEEMYAKLLDDLKSNRLDSPIYAHHVGMLANSSKSIVREEYLSEDADQIVVDYISSMTDGYFMAIYDYLFPAKHRCVYKRTYTSDLA